MIGYLDDFVTPLVFILPKMSGYLRSFKNKDGDKDKNKNNKLISFCIYDDKLLKNYKTIGIKLKTCKILNWMF